MVAHGVERNDAKSDEIEAAIDALIAPESFVVARLDPVEDPGTPPPEGAVVRHILVTRSAEFDSSQTFQMQVERVAEPRDAMPFIPIHRGFVRAGGPACWVLTGTAAGPESAFRLCASWKISVGRVEVLKNVVPIPAAPVGTLPAFPVDVLALGIDASD